MGEKLVGLDWAMLGSFVFLGNDHFLQIEQESSNTSKNYSLQKTK